MKYTQKSITQLDFLEFVRKLPGMYIGDADVHGLHHLALEIIDNAVDEVLAKFATRILVTIEKDGTFAVEDDGRGIPVEWKDEAQESTLTFVLTKQHAGGKFEKKNDGNENSAYSASGGVHGVGLKCANAMSSKLEATVKRYGLVFKQTFTNGGRNYTPVNIYDSTKKQVGQINKDTKLVLNENQICESLIVNGQTIKISPNINQKNGTEIRFRPNREWFSPNLQWDDLSTVPWSEQRLETRLSQLAFLNPGVKIEFLDKRVSKEFQEKKIFYSKNGLKDYIEFLTQDLKPLHKPIFFENTAEIEVNSSKHTINLQVALQYCDGNDIFEPNIVAFTNNIPNPDLGEHVSAFKAGFSKAINAVALQKKWVKSSDEFKNDDIFAGMTAIVLVQMSNAPQFSSQTKVKLTSTEVRGPIMSATYNFMSEWILKHAEIGKLIVQQAKQAKENRESAQKVRQTIIKKSGIDGSLNFLGKTADIRRQNGEPVVPKQFTSLYIVEGDSAGGGLKLGRDNRFHAVLPLRGKIQNSAKNSLSKMLDNSEIRSMIAAIGCGVGADFDIKSIRYGRIVIATDADIDGSHIQALTLTFFYKYMRPLIENNYVYIARPPLFRVKSKRSDTYFYAYTDKERDNYISKLGGEANVEVTRYKGLGEMNPEQLSETILSLPHDYQSKGTKSNKNAKKSIENSMSTKNEETFHKDYLVTIEDAHTASKIIDAWMGDSSEWRNKWLMSHNWNER